MKRSALAVALLSSAAMAAPVVTLHSANVGIGSITYSVVGTTITINENWTSAGPGVLLITGFVGGVNYKVVKNTFNDSGVNWNRLTNELLDKAGDAEDALDPLPYPKFVPPGFSTSNDFDGLSFAQGIMGPNVPRTSDTWKKIDADETTDARDFLDFYDGICADGTTCQVSYGIRYNLGFVNDFLLSQRPNAISRPEVPEPTTLGLAGLAVALMAIARKKLA
jgi:hypothetical protein